MPSGRWTALLSQIPSNGTSSDRAVVRSATFRASACRCVAWRASAECDDHRVDQRLHEECLIGELGLLLFADQMI